MILLILIFFGLNIETIANQELFLFDRDPFAESSGNIIKESKAVSMNNFITEGAMLILEGIIWDAENPKAIVKIQGVTNILSEDSKISDIELISISKKDVSLKVEDKKYILKIGKEIRL